MDMPEVGIGISSAGLGLLTGLAATYIKARFAAARKAPEQVQIAPDPLRVEIQNTYATKDELRDAEDRFERRLSASVGVIREDLIGLRKDLRENDEKAEARSVATHKRIDGMKDICVMRGKGGCK